MRRIALLLATFAGAAGSAGCEVESEAPKAEDIGAVIEPIIGGVPATEYPEAAILNMRTAAGANYACTASIIAPKVVLTAGHCVNAGGDGVSPGAYATNWLFVPGYNTSAVAPYGEFPATHLATTTGWRSDSDSFSATSRVAESDCVPAPKGTTMRIARWG